MNESRRDDVVRPLSQSVTAVRYWARFRLLVTARHKPCWYCQSPRPLCFSIYVCLGMSRLQRQWRTSVFLRISMQGCMEVSWEAVPAQCPGHAPSPSVPCSPLSFTPLICPHYSTYVVSYTGTSPAQKGKADIPTLPASAGWLPEAKSDFYRQFHKVKHKPPGINGAAFCSICWIFDAKAPCSKITHLPSVEKMYVLLSHSKLQTQASR